MSRSLFHLIITTYVCDRYKVSGILDERNHEGVVEDLIWDIQSKCKE